MACNNLKVGVDDADETRWEILHLFYWWRKLEYPEKNTNLPEVTDKLDYIMLHRVLLAWAGFELIRLVAICPDCIGSCKLSAEVKSTAQLKPRGRFTLIFVYELCPLFDTLLWLWNAEQQKMLFRIFNLCLSIMFDSFTCSLTSVHFLTNKFWKLSLFLTFTMCGLAYVKLT